MKKVGTVHALFISPKGEKAPLQKNTLTLDTRGIVGDKHYGKAAERTILITSLESYSIAKTSLGITMPHGYLGENLLIDFNPYSLALGTRLKIGECLLEISQNCTLCNHLAVLDKRIPKLLKSDRGIFAKVVSAGEIKAGDSLYLVAIPV
jgi:MOSC domain-containing protein YiiM